MPVDDINQESHQMSCKEESNQMDFKQENVSRKCDEFDDSSTVKLESIDVPGNNEKNKILVKSELDEPNQKYQFYLAQVERLKVPIIESINLELLTTFKDYTTRFYTDKYSVDFKKITKEDNGNFHDILVRIHTNGVLLIALAAGNSIIQSSKEITEINFKINNSDRSNIVTRGKRKSGAKFVKKETMVCQVKLAGDPCYYGIRAGVQGLLVEFNEIIKTKPNIIKTDPKGMGYVCIILPKVPQDRITETINSFDLLSEEDYFEYLSKRPKGMYWKKCQ